MSGYMESLFNKTIVFDWHPTVYTLKWSSVTVDCFELKLNCHNLSTRRVETKNFTFHWCNSMWCFHPYILSMFKLSYSVSASFVEETTKHAMMSSVNTFVVDNTLCLISLMKNTNKPAPLGILGYAMLPLSTSQDFSLNPTTCIVILTL